VFGGSRDISQRIQESDGVRIERLFPRGMFVSKLRMQGCQFLLPGQRQRAFLRVEIPRLTRVSGQIVEFGFWGLDVLVSA
jgi:hypothetical protein